MQGSTVLIASWCLGGAANWPTSTKVLLGRHGVSVVEGARHLQLRKILRPAFTVAAVNDLVPRMAAIAQCCCDKWAAEGRGKGQTLAKEFTFSVSLPICFFKLGLFLRE